MAEKRLDRVALFFHVARRDSAPRRILQPFSMEGGVEAGSHPRALRVRLDYLLLFLLPLFFLISFSVKLKMNSSSEKSPNQASSLK